MLLAEPARTPWDLKWSMLGFPIRVHPLFWLISFLLSYNKHLPISYSLIAVALVFVSILVHEFGHALAFKYFNVRQVHIILYGMGGLAAPQSDPPRRWPYILILFWGPGAGLILGGLSYVALLAVTSGVLRAPAEVNFAIFFLVEVNIIWSLANLLLPIFPLDGGQIMREIINWKFPSRGDHLVFTISFVASIIMAGVSIYYQQMWSVFLFGSLAYSSLMIRKQIAEYGDSGGYSVRREAWEQDPDWWKRG